MALSDKPTRTQLRATVRRELLDPSGRFFSDTEINSYLQDWQALVQGSLELVWGTATFTISPSSYQFAIGTDTFGNSLVTWNDLTSSWDDTPGTWDTQGIPTSSINVLRLDSIYYEQVPPNGTSIYRLLPRSTQELDIANRQWRMSPPGEPLVWYQGDYRVFSIWPPTKNTAHLLFDYPKILNFTDDVTATELPAWVKFTAAPYCCYRAYARVGPNHDLNKAGRRKKQFNSQLAWCKLVKAKFLPSRSPVLRPATTYEIDQLSVNRALLP